MVHFQSTSALRTRNNLTHDFMWSDWRRKNKRKTLIGLSTKHSFITTVETTLTGGQCGSLFLFLCCRLPCCLQAFAVVLLGKAHVPQELRVHLQQGKVWWENGNSKRMWHTIYNLLATQSWQRLQLPIDLIKETAFVVWGTEWQKNRGRENIKLITTLIK